VCPPVQCHHEDDEGSVVLLIGNELPWKHSLSILLCKSVLADCIGNGARVADHVIMVHTVNGGIGLGGIRRHLLLNDGCGVLCFLMLSLDNVLGDHFKL